MSFYDNALEPISKSSKGKITFPPFRFHLKRGEATQLTFLTNGSAILMRPVPSGRQWPDWVPCQPGAKDAKTFVAATVIDSREYTSKAGKVTPANQIKLFLASPSSVRQLEEISNEFGSIVGKTIKVKRSMDEKAPGVGDSFIYGKQPETPPTPMVGKFTLEEASQMEGFDTYYHESGEINYAAALTPTIQESETEPAPESTASVPF